MGVALLGLGWLLMVVGGLWGLVLAFKQSLMWGLLYIFVPLANVVFLIKHWAITRNAFFLVVSGVVLVVIGAVMGGVPVPVDAPAAP
jgi:hypothetical protein